MWPCTYSTTLRNRTVSANFPNGADGAANGNRAMCFQITVHGQRAMHGKRAVKRIFSLTSAYRMTVRRNPFNRGRGDRAAGEDITGHRQRAVDSNRPEDDERSVDAERPHDDRFGMS
ncbi:hypothetical protein WL88_19700 [Burkholderia diffusa]|uniref:Uncharacterized protein n=1 Tax=Burkholderia diffusa TaxID=488732 RepID=A0AAW3PFS2_9BURK|nr:hypothetical protein WL85_22660 [Burkholderia diffusa]KWF35202.1 hypothetical protein WL86_22055 [Burkholderia diffusa]KWF49321.1 hypothetical protein WL87_04855 [Burkholderia diffusa]KWF52173.1 hypothetical protein WL88_19700 [Burkholderia diffusa]